MALNNERYYYFKLRDDVEYTIKVVIFPINMNLTLNQKLYRELTTEQKEFYLANPTSSVQEVVNCLLTPTNEPTTPDVQDYAAQKVKELKDACYASVKISTLEYAAAEDKVNNITADSYYSLIQANQVLNDFRTQSKKALTVKNTYTPQIEAASTIEAIDTIYNTAISQL